MKYGTSSLQTTFFHDEYALVQGHTSNGLWKSSVVTSPHQLTKEGSIFFPAFFARLPVLLARAEFVFFIAHGSKLVLFILQ